MSTPFCAHNTHCIYIHGIVHLNRHRNEHPPQPNPIDKKSSFCKIHSPRPLGINPIKKQSNICRENVKKGLSPKSLVRAYGGSAFSATKNKNWQRSKADSASVYRFLDGIIRHAPLPREAGGLESRDERIFFLFLSSFSSSSFSTLIARHHQKARA